jgi:hypothetical protein
LLKNCQSHSNGVTRDAHILVTPEDKDGNDAGVAAE